jgi:hypothetical protein
MAKEGAGDSKPIIKQIVITLAGCELRLTEGEARRLFGALGDLFGRPEVRYVDRWHERPWYSPNLYGGQIGIGTSMTDQAAKQQYGNQLAGAVTYGGIVPGFGAEGVASRYPKPESGVLVVTVEGDKVVPLRHLQTGKVDGDGPKAA